MLEALTSSAHHFKRCGATEVIEHSRLNLYTDKLTIFPDCNNWYNNRDIDLFSVENHTTAVSMFLQARTNCALWYLRYTFHLEFGSQWESRHRYTCSGRHFACLKELSRFSKQDLVEFKRQATVPQSKPRSKLQHCPSWLHRWWPLLYVSCQIQRLSRWLQCSLVTRAAVLGSDTIARPLSCR